MKGICGRCSKIMIMTSTHKQEDTFYRSFHCIKCTNTVIMEDS